MRSIALANPVFLVFGWGVLKKKKERYNGTSFAPTPPPTSLNHRLFRDQYQFPHHNHDTGAAADG